MLKRSRLRTGLFSKTQIGLFSMIVLLFIALGSVVALAYINLTTSSAFQAGYVLSDLVNVQQELIQLHMDTNRVLRDRSTNFENLEKRRVRIDTQLQLAIAEASSNAQVTGTLRRVTDLLGQYDYQLQHLRMSPTEAQFRSSGHQFDSILDLLNKQVQTLYGNEELRFYEDIDGALTLQRTSQTLTVAIGGLLLIFGVMLVLSVGRSVSGEFQRAYNMLKSEVNERRRAEQGLLRQNEYLAALHQATLALMNRLDVEDVLETIVAQAAQVLNTAHGYAYLVDTVRDRLARKVGIGIFQKSIGYHLRPRQGVAGMVWYAEEPLVVNDYATWPNRAPTPGVRQNIIKAVMSVPLMSANRVVGVMGLAYDIDSGRTFEETECALLQSFAQLASIALDNARLFLEADQRTIQVQTLYHADEEIYRHLETNEVLHALVDVAVDILRADKSAMLVWNAERTHLAPQAARGFMPETLEKMVFTPDDNLVGHVATYAEPVVVRDTTSDKRVDWAITYPERIRSFIHVPIMIEGKVFGIFNVNYTETRAFTEDDLRLVLALAQRAALAIENARLYEQAQQAATLEERQRLARELHDAVTQTLFSASIIADVLPRLARINPAETERRLHELRDLTRGALAEMRTLLLELRPTALSEAALNELLHQLGEATTGRARVPVDVTTESHYPLPVDTKVALYRIAQEALNNIAKHANASQVHVTLRCLDAAETLELCIADDGVGFDPTQTLPDNLGLRIMRERAEEIGATLTIESQPQHGTRVVVKWMVNDA